MVPSLKSSDILDGVRGGDQGILPGSLLAPPPPGVPEYVDIRGPIGEAGLPRIVHSFGLDSDGGSEGGPEGAVEGGGGEDDLGEDRGGGDGAVEGDAGAVGSDAVEGFGPPLV